MVIFTFRNVNDIASRSSTNSNAYVFLGYDNNRLGNIGIAWMNTTCARKRYRTSISEWHRNDAVTAVVSFLFYLPLPSRNIIAKT